ncbi:MAG: polyprenyl synthetase family protein [Limnochordia bacterium]|nr:polyprenyl synthetase family protein [Limnochordia bacterium]
MKQLVLEIEAILDQVLPPAQTVPAVLHESMRYSTLGGGKRLRALLAMGACAAVGGDINNTSGLVAAIEMVQAYSLIHDDLPCMDDDDLRRGKPSNHVVYGEAVALLAGDALLTEAFAELASMPEKYGVAYETTVQVIGELARGAGSLGMVGGQVMDISSQDQELAEDTLRYIHEHKTGALFKAALRGGALLGGANPEELNQITRYAENFGLAFQITDDILDETGQTEQLGKAVKTDQLHGKQTYPRLYGLEKSGEMAERCVMECHDALNGFSQKAGLLRELASFIIQRDH